MAGSNKRETQLPIYRIKTIMKSSPGVENVSVESVHLVARATELFIRYLAKESLKFSDGDSLEYRNVAKIVNKDSRFEFLKDMIPQKITVRKYKELMNGKDIDLGTSDESDHSSDENSSQSDSG